MLPHYKVQHIPTIWEYTALVTNSRMALAPPDNDFAPAAIATTVRYTAQRITETQNAQDQLELLFDIANDSKRDIFRDGRVDGLLSRRMWW